MTTKTTETRKLRKNHQSNLEKKTNARSSNAESFPQKTLGPISDLERHLPTEWWKTLFNSVYLKTDGDVVENDGNTTREVDLLIDVAGLQKNDRILDLCCGQGRHCLELAKRGFQNVVGVDRSRYLVRLAKKRAKDRNLDVSFHEGDARKFRLKENNFQCVAMLGNSFGYFEREQDDLDVLLAVRKSLAYGGTVVLDLTNGQWMKESFTPRSWEWIDQNHFVCRERSLAKDGRRLISREVVVHAERGVIVDQFYAERLYSPGEISELLTKAGFEQIRQHEVLEADSERNQDLGMMAQRLVFTAKLLQRNESPAKSKQRFPKVTVLMGDPKLPDSCKRDGQFNEEDFATIEKLKSALGELDDFEFDYRDNHSTLISELREKPPEFVLNLCDEGFDNDAFKELHVPALLELLRIPYTGAGPTSLGLCYNKSFVRNVAESVDVPVPLETYVAPEDQSATLPSILPALVKPNFGDSSVGITANSVAYTAEALINRMDEMKQEFPGIGLLVQEYLTGSEYSVGIIGNPGQGFTFLPVLEVDYSQLDEGLPKILGYESKWLPDSPYWTQIRYHEANLNDDQCRQLCDHSARLFERLGCRDYARFDYRADQSGTIKLLEANPNPGWCWDGKLNFMVEYAGLRYPDLMRMIIEAAQVRVA